MIRNYLCNLHVELEIRHLNNLINYNKIINQEQRS